MSQAVLPLHQLIIINHRIVIKVVSVVIKAVLPLQRIMKKLIVKLNVIKVVLVMSQAVLPLQRRILMIIPARLITMVEDKGGIGWSSKMVQTKDSVGVSDALDSGETNKLFVM